MKTIRTDVIDIDGSYDEWEKKQNEKERSEVSDGLESVSTGEEDARVL
jgi:hypothetical protein